jgi:hypothetical protein
LLISAKNDDSKAAQTPAGKPSHIAFEPRPSMLSSEHPDNSYRGFVNVAIILLILANLRIVIQVQAQTVPVLA